MTKMSRVYEAVRFGPELFSELVGKARPLVLATSEEYSRNNDPAYNPDTWAEEHSSLSVIRSPQVSFTGDTWHYDDEEDFLKALGSEYLSFSFVLSTSIWSGSLSFDGWQTGFRVSVEQPTREDVLQWLAIIDEYADEHRIEQAEMESGTGQDQPAVFIGHGRSPVWHQVNTHLTSRGYRTVFYESEPRANRTIKDILAEMGQAIDFAVIVATAEDLVSEDHGEERRDVSRPRQNVIHEMGYFQALVGFDRTAVLLEEGTQTPSNYDGFQYIGFRPNHVGDVFGSLVEAIERERSGNH